MKALQWLISLSLAVLFACIIILLGLLEHYAPILHAIIVLLIVVIGGSFLFHHLMFNDDKS